MASKINPVATTELINGSLKYLGTLHPNDFVDVLQKHLLKRRMKATSTADWVVNKFVKDNNIDLSNPAHVKQLQEDLLDVDNIRVRLGYS